MRLLALTAASEAYLPLARLTAPGKLEYCLRWGHSFRSGVLPQPLQFGFRWAPLVEALSGGSCDWVMFTGADVLLTNHTIEVVGFCQAGVDLVVGEDVNGINNDVLLIRSCPACVEFLDRVAHFGPGLLGKPVVDDQVVMSYLLGGDMRTWRPPDPPTPIVAGLHAAVVPQKLLNSYPAYASHYGVPNAPGQWRPGDFAAHVPGLSLQERERIIGGLLGSVVR